MKKFVMFLVFLTMLLVVTRGYAQIKAGSFSVTPFIGGYLFEGNENLKNAPVFGLRGGYNFTKNWGVEGFFNYIPTENNAIAGNPDVKLYGYGIEGLYHFLPEGRLVPFLAVGAGGIHYSNPAGTEDKNKLAVDYGAGLKFFLTDSLALRADVRHVLPLNDRYNDLLYTLGIAFSFGGAKKALTEGSTVQQAAAPAEIVIDSDKDGISDKLDMCPDTPAGVKVDKDGCPADSDKDGVDDYLDKCPDTPIGVAVDNDGCPPPAPVIQEAKPQAAAAPEIVKKGRTTLDVLFEFDKYVIRNNFYSDIDNLAAVMKQYPGLKVTIEGHTDNIGSAAYNKKLSQQRADAVKKYMVEKSGIDPKRLTAKGFGFDKPVASNATREGRQKNRRVEAAADYIIKK